MEDRRNRVRALALIVGMVVACCAVWTASPLAWLWVASQIDSGGPPSMQAIGIVIVGVIATTLALAVGIARLNGAYRATTGTGATVKVHLPWLRSLRGERPHERGDEVELTVLDVILVSSVFLAIAIYELWFFFKAGSPLDQRSGRLPSS